MRRKRQTLVDIVRDMLERHQESVLHILQHYPQHKVWHLERVLNNHTRRMTEAILDHLRTVEAEERSALERELFDEEKTKGSARNDSQICSDRLDAQSAKESAPEQDSR